KRYKRPGGCGLLRRVRRPPRPRGDARRHRRARPEILGMKAVRGHARAREFGNDTAHKSGRAANVEIRVARHAQSVECVNVDASDAVEIDSRPIGRPWHSVTNVAAARGQGLEERAYLRRKWMLAAVAGAVNPPDLSRRSLGGQGVQHGED